MYLRKSNKLQNKMGKRGTLLSSFEQGKISAFFEDNLSTAQIARRLNRSHNTKIERMIKAFNRQRID